MSTRYEGNTSTDFDLIDAMNMEDMEAGVNRQRKVEAANAYFGIEAKNEPEKPDQGPAEAELTMISEVNMQVDDSMIRRIDDEFRLTEHQKRPAVALSGSITKPTEEESENFFHSMSVVKSSKQEQGPDTKQDQVLMGF